MSGFQPSAIDSTMILSWNLSPFSNYLALKLFFDISNIVEAMHLIAHAVWWT